MTKISSKYFYALILGILIIFDISTFSDLEYIKIIWGFPFLLIIPGLLITNIIKIHDIDQSKKFLLVVVLSVLFLVLTGLLVNSLQFLILKPLTFLSILITLNILIVLFIGIAYIINRENRYNIIPNFKLDNVQNFSIPMILIPILFPLLTIIGISIMNIYDNNLLLIGNLILILVYVIFLIIKKPAIPENYYSVVILLISISMLLIVPLRSNSIGAFDVNLEYFFFNQVANSGFWNPYTFANNYNSCVTSIILPIIFTELLKINGETIFRLFYPIIFSLTPLALYFLFKRYIGSFYSFLAAFLFITQYRFIMTMPVLPRVEIGLLAFAVAAMLLFDKELKQIQSRILLLLLIILMIFAHYATAYIAITVLLISWLIIQIRNKSYKTEMGITIGIVLFTFVLSFFWYSQVTGVPFSSGTVIIGKTFSSLSNLFLMESRDAGLKVLTGTGLAQIPYQIFVIVFYITNMIIGIGTLIALKWKKPFDKEYRVMSIVFLGLIIVTVALPYITSTFSIEKLYLQALVILAPMLIVGCYWISKKVKVNLKIILILVLIPQFLCGTYLIYQVWGVPYSYAYNNQGYEFERSYVHEEEISGAQWLNMTQNENYTIYTDIYGLKRVLGQMDGDRWEGFFQYDRGSIFSWGGPKRKGYFFLRYENVVNKEFIPEQSNIPFQSYKVNTNNYTEFLNNEIYTNGGTEIYYWQK